MLGAVALACLAATAGLAADANTVLTPSEIQWRPAPPFMRPGAQAAVLYGDPSKAGPFVLRIKFPAGYELRAHSHPVVEIVTIVSGTSQLGTGEVADPNKTKTLPAGSFFVLPPGTPHYAFFAEETVIQISTNGPWDVAYVHAADDPRKKP
jgi:quercetin dioxygenase-like cupin family protein